MSNSYGLFGRKQPMQLRDMPGAPAQQQLNHMQTYQGQTPNQWTGPATRPQMPNMQDFQQQFAQGNSWMPEGMNFNMPQFARPQNTPSLSSFMRGAPRFR